MSCPNCGNADDASARFCSRCGLWLPAAAPQAPGPRPEACARGSREELYKAILGPKNQDYYLRYFLRCDRNGRAGPSWHWPAFFATVLWLIYRKMWLNALLFYSLAYWLLLNLESIAVRIAQAVSGELSNTAVGGIYLACVFMLVAAGWIAPAIFANALYYRHCRRKISEAVTSSPDAERRLGELDREGGVGPIPLAFIAVPIIIAVVGTQAAVAIPAYEDLTSTHLARAANTGTNLGKPAAEIITPHQRFQ